MKHPTPDADTVRAAVALAVRAPSVHNSQPWRWHVDGRTAELRADLRRRLPHTDPDGRDLLVSCGCALRTRCGTAVRRGPWRTRCPTRG